MKRSTARILSVICTILVVIVLFCMVPSGNKWGMMILFLIYLPIAIVLNYFQRCRHCGRWPRKGDSWVDTYCPRCGKPLDDE